MSIVYYDVQITGKDVFTVASTEVQNGQPIVEKASDYDISVIKFYTSLNMFPIFVMPLATTTEPHPDICVSNGSNTIYSIRMTLVDSHPQAGQPVRFTHVVPITYTAQTFLDVQRPTIGVPLNRQPSDKYAWIMDIKSFLDVINRSLADLIRLFQAAPTPLPFILPPNSYIRMCYNNGDNSFYFEFYPASLLSAFEKTSTPAANPLIHIAELSFSSNFARFLDGFQITRQKSNTLFQYNDSPGRQYISLSLPTQDYMYELYALTSENFEASSAPVQPAYSINLFDIVENYEAVSAQNPNVFDNILTFARLHSSKQVTCFSGVRSIYILTSLPIIPESSAVFGMLVRASSNLTPVYNPDGSVSYVTLDSVYNQSSTASILMDFTPDMTQTLSNGALDYNSSGIVDSRRVSLIGSQQIQNFNINVMFTDNNGTPHPLLMTDPCSICTIKLAFIPKNR